MGADGKNMRLNTYPFMVDTWVWTVSGSEDATSYAVICSLCFSFMTGLRQNEEKMFLLYTKSISEIVFVKRMVHLFPDYLGQRSFKCFTFFGQCFYILPKKKDSCLETLTEDVS